MDRLTPNEKSAVPDQHFLSLADIPLDQAAVGAESGPVCMRLSLAK